MAMSGLKHRASRRAGRGVAHCIALALVEPSLAAAGSFVAFESGPVRTLAMAADGLHLYAVNIPDNRLEIFEVADAGLTHVASVPVGMEPVAVAARGNSEAWVVNHLSDSVSIVRLPETGPARVERTLHVGDEPRDLVFAGPEGNRAFITTANRNLPRDPESSERNADVWVFDAENLGDDQVGGAPLAVVNLYADVPRALATSTDGDTVYVAVFNSGNQTSVVDRLVVNGDMPPPLTNFQGVPAPDTSLIVRFNGTDWVDAAGRPWTEFQTFTMPDWDVFALDATTSPPTQTAVYSGVGTVLFNMVSNPASGNLYVTNLEARNEVRFEGPGEFSGSATVRGHFAENRITVIDDSGVHPRHLNKHIDYDVFPGTPEENAKSLALPLQMAVSADGSTLYAAAFGSSKIGVFDVAALEDDSFVPNEGDQIELSGGGPSGLALDEPRNRLYVLTRFDDSIVTVDLASRTEQAAVSLYNPEPASLRDGRRFLYDARYTSSRGDSACAGCHIFGDVDGLAWDLGNPDGVMLRNPNPFESEPPANPPFHPMKGPMTTQSLRGLANAGPMHWRGDRTGGATGGDPLDEAAAFKAFNVAFEGLLGRGTSLTDEEMQAFTDFALQLTYPPNPIRALDNSRTAEQERGRNFFFNFPSRPNHTCQTCHTLDARLGFYGTSGLSQLIFDRDDVVATLKIPHMRNLYTKEGITSQVGPPVGDQIRGFGFSHDGSQTTIFDFHREGFLFPGGDKQRMDVVAFLLAFDSNLAPIVGRQVTVTQANSAAAREAVSLLVQRARVSSPVPECDLIVKGMRQGVERGWLYRSDGSFHSDRINEPSVQLRTLLQVATRPAQELTFTCTPPGSGTRMGLDRDEDGYYDRDELDAGSDPADPGDIPRGRVAASAGR